MRKYAIVVAGGSGTRMNGETPKQFMLLAGMPVLMHTISRFKEADQAIEIIVVIPEKEVDTWKKLCKEHSFGIQHHVVFGGATRFQSVKNGFKAVVEKSLIAVHDGVRPFTSKDLINRSFLEAEKHDNAIPFIAANDSMRKITGNQSEIVDRNEFVLIQTPQCFDSEILIGAYNAKEQPAFTDDASVVEYSGKKINLIPGERQNIKITYPVDLVIGEAILEKIN